MKLPDPKDYPKKVYIDAEAYKIIFDKNMKDYGQADPVKHTIRIKAGMSKRETFYTLIHEVMHALDFEHNLKLKHKTVYKLEKSIGDFLIDNFM